MQMQAVKAYYNEGNFVPFQPIKAKKGSHAIVTILDFPINETSAENDIDDVSERQIEAMKRFIEMSDNCEEDIPEFERVKFREAEL